MTAYTVTESLHTLLTIACQSIKGEFYNQYILVQNINHAEIGKIIWCLQAANKKYILHSGQLKLDMSTARRRLKSPRWLSGTSAHPTKVTLVNVMVMNGWLTSFSFHVNRPPPSCDKAISDYDLEISKVKVMSEVKGQGHISYPVSNRCTSVSFHSNRTNYFWDMAKIMFDFEKKTSEIKKNAKIKIFNRTSQNLIV